MIENLQGGASLLILGEPGSGKTFLAKQVEKELGAVICSYTGSVYETLVAIAEGIGCPTEDEETGKPLKSSDLKKEISSNLNGKILVCDNAHNWTKSLRLWLESLYENGATLLLTATKRELEGITFKIPRLRLPPLEEEQIRQIILSENPKLPTWKISELASQAGGNPMLAMRLVEELQTGTLTPDSKDGSNYRDASPAIMGLLSGIGMIRFIGLASGDKGLYIIGGISLTVFVMLKSFGRLLPRGNRRT